MLSFFRNLFKRSNPEPDFQEHVYYNIVVDEIYTLTVRNGFKINTSSDAVIYLGVL